MLFRSLSVSSSDSEYSNKDDESLENVEDSDVIKEKEEKMKEKSIPDFETIKLAPIHVQQGRDKKITGFEGKARHIWKNCEVNEWDLKLATDELFESVDHLLDVTSYNGLVSILNFSTIIVSICLGWGFGSGICRWKLNNNYLKCDI